MRTRSSSIISILIAAAACNGEHPPLGADRTTISDVGSSHQVDRHVRWVALEVPTESVITGGPWTLEQEGTSAAAPSAGFCKNGVKQTNPATMRMQPYYFPFTVGSGSDLIGYFDYRPKDNDEAIVAASSADAGHSWTFLGQALELTTSCPASDAETLGGDDGQGHPYVLDVDGTPFLYTLDRTAGNVDQSGLAIHVLSGSVNAPLDGTPATLDASLRTSGLLNADGVIGVVPGARPTTIIYLQKQLKGDEAFPSSAQCSGAHANHDVVTPRLATTEDGINFQDLGPVAGLNDPTDVTTTGMRYLGPRGTILPLAHHRYGLFFSAGSCIDNDSDAFHAIGYAESRDLVNWTVVNGIDNPIASIMPVTIDGANVPSSGPIIGNTHGWFGGRLYGPSVTILDARTVVMTFAGYHTAKPKNAMGDYRSIGRVILGSSEDLSSGFGP